MYDTIVIGAGQAGLATGYYLKQTKQSFILLDKCSEVGESWKERYDSLVLFTPRIYSSLPGMVLEGEEQGFPVKDEIASYLKKYVNKFKIPIQFNTTVVSVTKVNDYFLIETNKQEYQSKNVVIATGSFQTPSIPSFSQGLSDNILQLHSSQYKNPEQLIKGNVLVIGGGNSGAQIAVEVSEERDTYLACSGKLKFLPMTVGSKSIFWWFDKLGILKANEKSLFGKLLQQRGDPIFGHELKKAIHNNKVITRERVTGANESQVIFKDTSTLEANNIIWATGFKMDFPWLKIDGVFNREGKVIHERGVSNIQGLSFIGLPWQYRRGSALLQGVGYDAEFIVSQI
ncbi:flavin-containing monooxygenase [Oceanobacillus alkalisoli]|uniref:flavin-containing monooxygenase n=1 Tax=Oceanobacillus alkalisoli TaxID=2925113 RepID=UPI001EF03780|nr:NAD(P)/FAD-dependent oxidoreductase [Oceanobacillus alkalisoli]MCF3942256.1 NAD(P)/FAD-dependent oxidoreductase [Oceanobacillus alkalisoli]MCG5104492.1 NAD(P)/FAD-dependent oxidoreductase [Oceanobacillus alkalisoli]